VRRGPGTSTPQAGSVLWDRSLPGFQCERNRPLKYFTGRQRMREGGGIEYADDRRLEPAEFHGEKIKASQGKRGTAADHQADFPGDRFNDFTLNTGVRRFCLRWCSTRCRVNRGRSCPCGRARHPGPGERGSDSGLGGHFDRTGGGCSQRRKLDNFWRAG